MSITAQLRSRFRFAGDLGRAADVVKVLAKYGLAGWLAHLEWEPIQRAFRSEAGEPLSGLTLEARIRLVLTDLGTTFIKFGQMLSTRADLVGDELAAELSKLQTGTPADPPEVARKVFSDELGRPVEECFRRFEDVPLASASIGQVHRAKLRTGKAVVVKLQHPGISGIIRQDLDILRFLAEVAEKNEALRRYQPVSVVREFGRTMLNELDFRREQRNLLTFRKHFADDESVVFPRPVPELTSGKVLTMELIEGVPVSDVARVDALQLDREEIARRGANVFVEMIFRDGVYHADPHPGNILVLPDGRLGLLDAGMVGRIDATFQKQIEDILLAAADQDSERLTEAVTRVCAAPDDLDRTALSGELTELFQEFGTQAVGEFNVSGALGSVTGIIHRHKLIMPGKLSMLIKCLILLEGTGRLLSPAFSLAELLEPWRKRFLMKRFSPQAQLKHFQRLFLDWERLAEMLPHAIGNLVERLEQGKLPVKLELRHLKSAADRVAVGMFVAALLLGSSLMLAHAVPPMIRGVSILGLLGYLASMGAGVWWMWSNRDGAVARKKGDWD